MCGRVVNHLDLPTMRKIAKTNASRRTNYVKRGFNIGPMSHQAGIVHASHFKDHKDIEEGKVVEETKEENILSGMKWGFTTISSTKTSDKPLIINLRLETLENKFSRLGKNRCIIMIQGYYEWKDSAPYLVKPKNQEIFYLAALFSIREDGETEYGIITVSAPNFLQWLHHRSPAIVNEDSISNWLNPNISFAESLQLLNAPSQDKTETYQVPKLVNSVKNDSSDCIMKFEDYQKKLKENGISRFFIPIKKRSVEDDTLEKKQK